MRYCKHFEQVFSSPLRGDQNLFKLPQEEYHISLEKKLKLKLFGGEWLVCLLLCGHLAVQAVYVQYMCVFVRIPMRRMTPGFYKNTFSTA